ncbi:hypothetical protein LJE08_04860 [Holdemanella sp. DFI.5.55]|uniref:hypothetical protein n=1 Tax=Holdemanella sp. DFI.5.55 TaxID=2885263 RepID=UPI001D0A8577|nr:hypothetical protein [Holdemanella sp. DFI.5.55]MCB8640901.1 hypothetical protein [Holdemanella sp. DFI.5.55]
MKIIVDEINPQDCPFYIGQDWNNHGLPIEYYEGYCRLSAEPWGVYFNTMNATQKTALDVLSALHVTNLKEEWVNTK